MDGSGLRTACPTTPPENLRGLRRSEGTVVQSGVATNWEALGARSAPQVLRKLRRCSTKAEVGPAFYGAVGLRYGVGYVVHYFLGTGLYLAGYGFSATFSEFRFGEVGLAREEELRFASP